MWRSWPVIATAEGWFSSWHRPGEGPSRPSAAQAGVAVAACKRQLPAPCLVPPQAAAAAWAEAARLHQREGLDVGGKVGAHLQDPGSRLGDCMLGAGETNHSGWSLQTFIGVLGRRETKSRVQMPMDCSALRGGEGRAP